ncbi:hypothetical protein GCM10025784_01800 [Citricoccus nitrophenolicus]
MVGVVRVVVVVVVVRVVMTGVVVAGAVVWMVFVAHRHSLHLIPSDPTIYPLGVSVGHPGIVTLNNWTS